MKISNNWLKEFVDYGRDIDTLTNDLETIGHELESVRPLVNATGLVVGEVKTCEKHPDADKLSVCTVNIGTELTTIVCGAPNVRSNIKVIVATVGAVLPGNFKIGQAKLKGIISNGMLCSLAELGFESKYLTDADKDGIHVLGDDAVVGTNALDYLSFNDQIIDLDITPNRGDMLNMIGIASEVASYYNLPVVKPRVELNEIPEATDLNIKINTDNCSLYAARVVKNVVIRESPNFIKARLIAGGIRPINNVVDISNYVMLEIGQPLHFFDLNEVGNDIIVRMAKENEKITTLDNQERILKAEDIVIANKNGAVALAGVMGGLTTEVTVNTKDILIEAAIFNPVNIHFTSKRILRSEASTRFVKGISKETTLYALDRAAYLLNKYASGQITKNVVMVDHTDDVKPEIIITIDKINNVIGSNISKLEIIDILERLNMTVKQEDNNLLITPPHYRLDLKIAEDIIEEVARFYGINKINSKPLVGTVKPGRLTNYRHYIKNINQFLQAQGFNEVLTYTLTNSSNNQDYYLNPLLPVLLNHPMSQDKTELRTTLIPSLMEVYEYNKARKINDIMIYETSEISYLDHQSLATKTLLTVLASGSLINNDHQKINIKHDFYSLKGTLESLLNYLGLNNRYQLKRDKYHQSWHPYATASIYVDNICIGLIGMINPTRTKDPVYVMELDLSLLQNFNIPVIKYQAPRKYPSIIKDVSFIVDQNTDSCVIIDLIKLSGGKDLINVEVFDVYQKETSKSISYKLTFASDERTLTDEEVNHKFNEIIEFVNDKIKTEV